MMFLSVTTLLAVLLASAVVEGKGLRRLADDHDGSMHSEGMLGKIEERGKLLCGEQDTAGFANFRADGSYDGLEVDLCHAIAAAIFGDTDPEHYEIVATTSADRFMDLAADKFDVLIKTTTHTLSRDVNEANTGMGYTFTVPYFYDGLKYAGPKGNCADALDWESADCSDLKICVSEPTTWFPRTQALFPPEVIVAVPSSSDGYLGLNDGRCNAIAGEGTGILLSTAVANGYTGGGAMMDPMEMAGGMMPEEMNKAASGWQIGTTTYSKEPLAMVTREDDPAFSDFVNWVLQGLMSAEEQGITDAATPMKEFSGFGEEHTQMFNSAVAAVGNYGQIYERNMEKMLPRGGLNMLNTDNDPQQYPHPM